MAYDLVLNYIFDIKPVTLNNQLRYMCTREMLRITFTSARA